MYTCIGMRLDYMLNTLLINYEYGISISVMDQYKKVHDI